MNQLDRRERADRPESDQDRVRDDDRGAASDCDRDDVPRGREAPDSPVDPERHEEDVAGAQQNRKQRKEDRALVRRSEGAHHEDVGGEERAADEHEVGDDLDQATGLEDDSAPERRWRPFSARTGAFFEVAEEAPELNEQDEGQEHTDRGEPCVVEDVVGESGRADGGGDEGEQEDSLRL